MLRCHANIKRAHNAHTLIGSFRCPLFRGPLIISLYVFI